MKFLLIPDSFKGTLSSEQICGLLNEKIKLHFPDAETVSIPMADHIMRLLAAEQRRVN